MVLARLEAAHGLTLDRVEPSARDHWVREIIESVVLALDHVDVTLSMAQIRACAEALGERSDGGGVTGTAAASPYSRIRISSGRGALLPDPVPLAG